MTYGPAGGVSVPTLSGALLILLSILLAIMVFRTLRAKDWGRSVAILAAAGIVAAGSGTGGKIIVDAQAAGGSGVLSLPQGGTVQLTANVPFTWQNTSGVTQRILDITISCGSLVPSGLGHPECAEGLTIPPGGSCGILIDCI